MNGRPNRRNEAALSNFSGMELTPPQSAEKRVYINFSKQPVHFFKTKLAKHKLKSGWKGELSVLKYRNL